MGIRKEIKLVIKEYAGCTIGQVEAINAISNIVNRPKPTKFPKIHSLEELVAESGRQAVATAGKTSGCTQTTQTHDKPNKAGSCEESSHFITVINLEDLPFPEAIKEILKKF